MSAAAPVVWSRATSLASSADWLRSSMRDLDQIGELRFGWDSYGSQPISPDALGIAHELVFGLASRRTQRPEIRPVAGGGLQFEWRAGQSELEILIAPAGRAYWMLLSRTGESFDGEFQEYEIVELAVELAGSLFPSLE